MVSVQFDYLYIFSRAPSSRGGQWGRGSPGSPSRDGDGDRKFDNPGTGTGMGTDSGGRGQERGLKIEKRGLKIKKMGTGDGDTKLKNGDGDS